MKWYVTVTTKQSIYKRSKKTTKENIQNTVTREHIRVDKESHISNASSSTETDKNKKDQNRNNQVKSVVIIGNSMIKHLNGWDMSKSKINQSVIYTKPLHFTRWNEWP